MRGAIRSGIAICWDLTVLFVVLFSAASGQGSKSDEVAKQFAEAAAATQQHDFARAEEGWRKVLALDPKSVQAYNNLGMVYYLQHKYPEAEKTLRRALQLDTSLVQARVLLGASLGRQGKQKPAIAELDQALKSHMDESAEKTGRLALHEVLFAKQDYSRALEVLKPLAKRYPHDVEVLYRMGQTHFELAQQSFLGIASVDPQSYRIHQILAESLAKQGHYQDAIREYRLALEQRPDLQGIHLQIGLLLLNHQRTEAGEQAALREFEEELKINPYDAPSEYRLGRIDEKRGDLEKAALHLYRAIQFDESYLAARLALARLLEEKGDLDEAQKQAELARELEPGNAAVHYRLAQLYKRKGNPVAAGEALKKFEQIQAGRRGLLQELERALGSSQGSKDDNVGDSVP